jgi:hypothetical protein
MEREVASPEQQESAGRSDTAQGERPKGPGRPRRVGLDALDHRMIAALLMCPTRASAAAAVGVSEKTIRRRFQEQEFRDKYFRQLDELLAKQWSTMATARKEIWHRFMVLVRCNDDAIALRACTWYFDHMARRMPTLQLRRDVDEDEVEPPVRLRALYEQLEEQGAENGER